MPATNAQKIADFNSDSDVLKDGEKRVSRDVVINDPNSSNQDILKEYGRPETEQERTDRIAAEEEQQRKDAYDAKAQLTDQAQNVVSKVNSGIEPAKQWMASLPTPGGILAILAFIIFMAMIVIPVNDQGQTRMYLLWQTILGRTHMAYNEQTGGTSSGDFGSVTGDTGGYGGGASGSFTSTTTQGTSTPLVTVPSNLNLFGL